LTSCEEKCRVCGSGAKEVGIKRGTFKPEEFRIFHCSSCRFSFVSNPWREYEKIYSAAYYSGRGADPMVNYLHELENPEKTIRYYEWRGILAAIQTLASLGPQTKWLDIGCGNGGLVRFCRERSMCQTEGYEDGWIKNVAAAKGIPFRAELQSATASYDIVTAIEVLEHVENPIEFLCEIRRILKPGGIFFYTTGNAKPYRHRLLSWRYIVPEVHISFFEPGTLEYALQATGFSAHKEGFMPGFSDMIRFKVLKNVGIRTRGAGERMLPWWILSRLVDKMYRLSDFPIGRAQG